jgi:hypothetical protein
MKVSVQNVHWKILSLLAVLSLDGFFSTVVDVFRRRLRSFLPLRLLPNELYDPSDSREPDHAAEDTAEWEVDCSKEVTDAALLFEHLESSRLEPKPCHPKVEDGLNSSA